MHATTEQLLSYRDKQPLDAKCKLHVQSCDLCQIKVAEFESLTQNLKELPMAKLDPSELKASWANVSSTLSTNNASVSFRNYYWPSAVAAILVVALFINFNPPEKNGIQDQLIDASIPTQTSIPLVDGKDPVAVSNVNQGSNQLAQLVAYSRALEDRLQSMPAPRVVRADTAGTISQLQDQISMVDNRLNLDAQTPLTEQQRNALWQQRVSSMNNLYRVRTAQLQRVAY